MPAKSSVRREPLSQALRKVLEWPALRTTLLVAGGGIALMLANLLYAKMLDPDEFGKLVLMQSIAFVTIALLPMGFETLIARREIDAPLGVVYRVLALATALATALLAAVVWLIDGSAETGLLVLFAGIAGSATRLFAAIEQSEQNFVRSQLIFQAPSVIFLCCALSQRFLGISSWREGGAAYVLSFALGSLIGFVLVRQDDVGPAEPSKLAGLWPRALAMIGIFAATIVLNQLPLFVAAARLSMHDVGALGLATTLIAAPYKMLSVGVGYALLPRMAAVQNDKLARRKLLLQEVSFVAALAVIGALALYLLVPIFVAWYFSDEYVIGTLLIIALLMLGLIRVNNAVFAAAISALAGTRALHFFNVSGWFSVAIAAGAALALSGYGATGIVAGITIGWVTRIVIAIGLIRKVI